MQPLQICIGPSIRIGRESWCLPYAGFFSHKVGWLNMRHPHGTWGPVSVKAKGQGYGFTST